ncbi:hypothetical protein N0V82_003682 [Gnomoniopsis sp. IMI 355080]|nr:hypothetical protein N0V82_003682 [Gnomoniopsis sp. IMI 355080]
MHWLKKVSQRANVFIFVDALDEHLSGHELLGLLFELSKAPGKPMIIVTSRPVLEVDIDDDIAISRLNMEDRVAEIDDDIRQYVLHRLTADNKMRRWSQERYRNLITDGLLYKSNGMFRWASCQLDAISRVRTPREVRKALASLPAGLHDTYRRILDNVSREDSELLRKMLVWLCFCTKGLSQQELREAIAIQHNASSIDEESQLRSTEDILELGNSLISVAQTQNQVVLAHLSVRDYLLSDSLQRDSRVGHFALAPRQSHTQLATDCLTYLFFEELSSGPCESADDYMERLGKMPFLKHAANAWSYHLRAAEVNEDLFSLVLRLFLPESRSTFMSWIQVINTGSDSNFKWNIYPRHATSLYYAASFGLRDVLTYLLEQGMEPKDLNAPGSRFGGTALHAAALREHLEVMEDLIKAGANPSTADFNGVSPLHSAASQGSVEATRILLRFGAATDARDSMMNATPLEWARKSGRLNVVLLLEAADAKLTDSDSSTSFSSLGQSTPKTSTRSSSSTSQLKEASAITEDGITVWKPVAGFFPDYYEKRSGLTSSIVLGFAIGSETTTLYSKLDLNLPVLQNKDEAHW